MQLDVDACVVGAGPVGLAVAAALADHGWNVALLESGGKGGEDPASRALNAARQVGIPIGDPQEIRARAVGGTSTIWNTVREGESGARFLPLDRSDTRDWPVPHDELLRWYAAAHAHLGLPPFDYDPHHWNAAGHPLLDGEADLLRSALYFWRPARAAASAIVDRLATMPTVELRTGSTVTGLRLDADGTTVRSVRVATPDHPQGEVRARQVVLAAGTIENTRLLWDLPAVAGPWLGRGLMEHPIDRHLTVTTRHPALAPTAGFHAFERLDSGQQVIGRLVLAPAFRESEELIASSVRVFPTRPARLARTVRAMHGLLGRIPATRHRVLLDLEQRPSHASRIVPDRDTDRHGRPLAVIDWQWTTEDEVRRTRVRRAVRRGFEALGHGTAVAEDARPLDPVVHHASGTTRMSRDAHDGVVDPQLRVHGIANLHVVGASTFPTAGAANPTLTAIALALRLGHHLAATA